MLAAPVPGSIAIPVELASHHLAAARAAAASQVAVLEQLQEKLEVGEPPEKKVALTAEEQQQLVQHALQHNLLAVASQFPMNVKISNRGSNMQHLSLSHPIPWHPREQQQLERSMDAWRGRGPASLSWAGSCFCFSYRSYWYFLSPDDRQETALNLSTNGISSINMSIEINGVVYTGK